MVIPIFELPQTDRFCQTVAPTKF